MSNSIKKVLKKYFTNKEYDKYNELLIKEITYIFVKKVQKINSDFLYSSLVELLETVEVYLNRYEYEIFKKFYTLVKADYQSSLLANELMQIYIKVKD